ncbi:hypothetical protein PPL_03984 [Heterostelium album PN500]|uniref:Uncharacterized protein n=1 Tax=Heterostelium pallidum (strain ATCC 26659 / Pp 5 / PN500) TaxID=670386 RepID=D3B5P6_HETP5|nr:hypothetical protein PPL_03984 [Heterostelium album PN500]EFA83194.1 hypothetical protein PPL_03984 [Heterostelium album PN500]|eukprot:XP_020435311.1 hypothetical protein PPL_03984 [Heterostelium album PN500]
MLKSVKRLGIYLTARRVNKKPMSLMYLFYIDLQFKITVIYGENKLPSMYDTDTSDN